MEWALFDIAAVLCFVGACGLGTLFIPWLLQFCTHTRQNLRKRYGAEWALVTGASSGIGLAICHKLAAQGLSVVLIAVPDQLLTEAATELRAAYPAVEFRAVGVDLSRPGYMEAVAASTRDITVQLLFNNAGYVVTGFFADIPVAKWLANVHCNAVAALELTHFFLGQLRASGRTRGAIAFTSSPANIITSPFASTYGASKALLTHFATSLACELAPEGVDVSVIHPSPVSTRFYDLAHALPTLKMFQSTGTSAETVADVLLAGLGRAVIIDQGYYPIVLRAALHVLDGTLLSQLSAWAASGVADYKFLKAQQAAAQSTPRP